MRLRAVSYNIHKGIGGVDRRYDLDRIHQVIAAHEPDVLLLQEVSELLPGRGRVDQVPRIAAAVGLRHHCSFVNVRTRRLGHYGNAILSRFPILHADNHSLKLPVKKNRSVVHARLRVRTHRRTRSLHVFNLHLGLAEFERRIQLRRFMATDPFARLHHRTPILLGGDFNDVWGSLGRILVPEGFRATERKPRTFPAFAPIRALDSIYLRGDLQMHRLQTSRLRLARQASDHLPLVADLEIGEAREGRDGGR